MHVISLLSSDIFIDHYYRFVLLILLLSVVQKCWHSASAPPQTIAPFASISVPFMARGMAFNPVAMMGPPAVPQAAQADRVGFGGAVQEQRAAIAVKVRTEFPEAWIWTDQKTK